MFEKVLESLMNSTVEVSDWGTGILLQDYEVRRGDRSIFIDPKKVKAVEFSTATPRIIRKNTYES